MSCYTYLKNISNKFPEFSDTINFILETGILQRTSSQPAFLRFLGAGHLGLLILKILILEVVV